MCSTALQYIVPVPLSVETTFTAIVGDTAVLTCPISPGTLLQSYSVRWMKDSVAIVDTMNPQNVMRAEHDPKYDIDSTYSLVIYSVNMNDSSSGYQCVMFSTNPLTGTKSEVQPNRTIPLSLNILGMYDFILV